jgi:type III restriction enzyme
VKLWIRNVARHPMSFWLPTSGNRFYPDFVAQLNDGRIFVAEYKGPTTANLEETPEKALIGALWAKAGCGVFAMIYDPDLKQARGLSVEEQLKKALGVNE